MTYQCQDCSYTRRGSFPAGRCPACGSYNVHRDSETESAPALGKRWRLLISIVLWLVFIYLLYRKF